MSSTDKTATNGKVANTVLNSSKTETKKPELSNLVITTKSSELTTNQKLEKLNELNAISERLTSLQNTKEKLGKFKLQSDKNLDVLGIKDGFGNEFRTYNTMLIKDVIDLLMKQTELKMADTEQQLIF